VTKTAAIAELDAPQGAAASGTAGALATLARSRHFASQLMNFGAGSTVAKLLRCPDLSVRVQAACTVVLLGWHAPHPTEQQLEPPSTLERREPPAQAEARRLATLRRLAPPLFHVDAQVPLDGLHRGALVRSACTTALLGALQVSAGRIQCDSFVHSYGRWNRPLLLPSQHPLICEVIPGDAITQSNPGCCGEV